MHFSWFFQSYLRPLAFLIHTSCQQILSCMSLHAWRSHHWYWWQLDFEMFFAANTKCVEREIHYEYWQTVLASYVSFLIMGPSVWAERLPRGPQKPIPSLNDLRNFFMMLLLMNQTDFDFFSFSPCGCQKCSELCEFHPLEPSMIIFPFYTVV